MLGPFYFGCWVTLGHYLYDKRGDYVCGDDVGFPESSLDCKLAPETTSEQGVAKHYNLAGYTLLAFWDRSVDRRPGGNSVFILPGCLGFDESIAAATQAFPKVWARFTFPIKAYRRPRLP